MITVNILSKALQDEIIERTDDKMKEGYSKIQNRGIAHAFSYMKIIESWGSGIPRMILECKECGLREPELIDAEGDFRINIYRNDPINGTNGTKNGTDGTKNGTDGTENGTDGTEDQLLSILKENPEITRKEMSERMELSLRTLSRLLSELKDKGLVIREGSARNGIWRVTSQKEK